MCPGYDNRIRVKYTAKWGVQIAGMIFQTCPRKQWLSGFLHIPYASSKIEPGKHQHIVLPFPGPVKLGIQSSAYLPCIKASFSFRSKSSFSALSARIFSDSARQRSFSAFSRCFSVFFRSVSLPASNSSFRKISSSHSRSYSNILIATTSALFARRNSRRIPSRMHSSTAFSTASFKLSVFLYVLTFDTYWAYSFRIRQLSISFWL
ncbi:hypothetical protein DWZ38_06365 [Ruminococcus sp. AF31-8BH]|nr:hypothetical protein DWZ38_06365 [Ruminococcus sp. AF31-8BH]